jgi:hypothetical protein
MSRRHVLGSGRVGQPLRNRERSPNSGEL